MKGFTGNIEKDTMENKNFRKVLYTAQRFQLVLMCLKPGEEIGEETHNDTDQYFHIVKGNGKGLVDGHEYELRDGNVLLIPAGARHNVINTAKEDLKLYTLYSPPQHKDGLVCATKKEAEDQEEKFDGKTTEKGKGTPAL